MYVSENEAIVRRWFDQVWNKKRLDVVDELLAPTTIDHGLPDVGPGRGAFRHYAEQFLQAFPDLYVAIEELRGDGDMVEVRGVYRATHKGTWAGHKATGNKVEWPLRSRMRVAEGKIVEAWSEIDTEAFMRQLVEKDEDGRKS